MSQLSFARRLFAIASASTALIGLAWMVAPELMFDQWNVAGPSGVAVYMARRYATMFFGYSVLLWLAREAAASPAGRAIAAGTALVAGALMVVSAWGALAGVVGPAVWAAAAIEAVLCVGFARVWFRG